MSSVPPTNRTVARRVKAAMEGAEPPVSEVTLAEQSGVSRTTLRRRLTGGSAFDLDELLSVAEVLKVRLTDLLADEDPEQVSA